MLSALRDRIAAILVGPMGLGGGTLVGAQVATFFVSAALNIGLNFYNSYLLTPHLETDKVFGSGGKVEYRTHSVVGPQGGFPNFNFAVFYTMWHMAASVLGATVILLTVAKPAQGFPRPTQFWLYKWPLLAISVCSVGNIACNNVSLTMISLFLNQVIKATGPLPTMLFSIMFERKTYGWGMILSCVAIVGGTILAVPSSSHGETSGAGVIVVIIATIAASLKPVVAAMVMQGTPDRPKLAPTVVLFYDTFISFWLMFLYWLCSPERAAVSAYFATGHAGLAAGLILAGATMAFGFNISNYFFVLLTSALTTTVTANAVKVINIVISAIISHISAPRNWVGVALVCVALAVYAYFSYMAKLKPPAKLGLPFLKEFGKGSADTEAGKPTEGTPLRSDSPPDEGVCCIIS